MHCLKMCQKIGQALPTPIIRAMPERNHLFLQEIENVTYSSGQVIIWLIFWLMGYQFPHYQLSVWKLLEHPSYELFGKSDLKMLSKFENFITTFKETLNIF